MLLDRKLFLSREDGDMQDKILLNFRKQKKKSMAGKLGTGSLSKS